MGLEKNIESVEFCFSALSDNVETVYKIIFIVSENFIPKKKIYDWQSVQLHENQPRKI